jgi:hypothetical protein
LDGRVFVALTRGLWDLASKGVLDYAEGLSEGRGGSEGLRGAWRGRRAAALAARQTDAFFRSSLAAAMGNDLKSKDTAAPQHAERARRLLAENDGAALNLSFDVF